MKEKRKSVLTFGVCGVDLDLFASHLPTAGETVDCEAAPVLHMAGRAGNSALALSALGVESVLCSTVGSDLWGEKLFSNYAQKGVDTRFLYQSQTSDTAFFTHLNTKINEKAHLCYGGDCCDITEEHLKSAFESKPDLLLANLDLPFDKVYYAIYTAKETGIPVVLDATMAPSEINLSTLPEVDVLIVDDNAVQSLTGVFPSRVEDCMKAVLALARSAKARYYILQLEGRGCYLYDGRLPHFVAGYRMTQRDSRGAMEAFCAAICVAVVGSDLQMDIACNFASAAYALTASKAGIENTFPTISEISNIMTEKA